MLVDYGWLNIFKGTPGVFVVLPFHAQWGSVHFDHKSRDIKRVLGESHSTCAFQTKINITGELSGSWRENISFLFFLFDF